MSFTTIPIVPVGLYNASLQRQGVKLIMVEDHGQYGVRPTEDDENVEMQVGDLVNRLVELDQIVNFVVRNNVDKLIEVKARLRQAYETGDLSVTGEDPDELDDLLASFKGYLDNLVNTLKEATA